MASTPTAPQTAPAPAPAQSGADAGGYSGDESTGTTGRITPTGSAGGLKRGSRVHKSGTSVSQAIANLEGRG